MNLYMVSRTNSVPGFRRIILTITVLLSNVLLFEQYCEPLAGPADTAGIGEQGYRIDQPGTITFTVGVKISGKVDKPQVMIFLPKEKSLYREEVLTRSFADELSQPLPFTPVIR